VDARVGEHLVDEALSIGDYVLSGGELAALVVTEAVIRLLPGALGDEGAAGRDSFAGGLLEHPHYTRPEVFRGWPVPPVLLSGDHAKIARWRRLMSLWRTWERRRDLLETAELSPEEQKWIDGFDQGRRPEDVHG
jgi:tRNA (guanine37-N1)-methyltransferase